MRKWWIPPLLILPFVIALPLWLAIVQLELSVHNPAPSAKWYDDLVDIKTRIARGSPSPKLLMVGGSGTLFGIRAEKIQAELGKPTVNFGLFADISLPVILNMAYSVARPGDLVVLALEYRMFTYDRLHPQPSFRDYVLGSNRDVLSQLPYLDRLAVAAAIPPDTLRKSYRQKRAGIDPYPGNSNYSAATINKFGDETSFPDTPVARAQLESMAVPGVVERSLVTGFPEGNDAWDVLEDFLVKCRQAGIRVVATFPNLMDNASYRDRLPGADQITAFYRGQHVPILGGPRDALFADTLFYDHIYHMNEKGRELRTAKLIDLLRTASN